MGHRRAEPALWLLLQALTSSPDRTSLSTARCPPQKPALPSPHSSARPPQSNRCSEVRDATSGPRRRLCSLSSQHLPFDCQKTIFRGLSLLHMLQARHSLPFFFLHDLFKNVCAAKSLGDKESIFLWSKGRHVSWPLQRFSSPAPWGPSSVTVLLGALHLFL